MAEGDKREERPGQWGGGSCDLLVVGGGIMGLWAALKAGRAGLRVLLADEGQLGGGASHGHLGALMPYMPDKWDGKKQFQFDALLSLEDEVAALEAETGLSAGYRRSGRLILLPKPHLRKIALRHEEEAKVNWQSGGRRFEWRVTDTPPAPGWPDAAGIDGGFVLDTFAARANPRAFTATLAAALRGMKNVVISEGVAVGAIDAQRGKAEMADGASIAFARCVIAAGYKSFKMLQALPVPAKGGGDAARPLGLPVKGQSALMAADVDPALPLIFLNGLYVIPHEDGRVAIGSTSEETFDAPFSTDGRLEALVEGARNLVPALRNAPVIERWAGLRPKALQRDPIVGPVPGHENIIALTGGFKISFGIAHRLADAVVDAVLGKTVGGLPESFRTESHLL